MGIEKRRAPRAKHDSVLEIVDRSGRVISAVGRLVNVSTVGVCFASTHSFKKGDKIHARVRLLREGRLNVNGHIVWTRKKSNHFLYGMEFDAVRAAHA